MDNDPRCVLCQNSIPKPTGGSAEDYTVQCKRCGTYRIRYEASRDLSGEKQTITENLYLVSAEARRYWELNQAPKMFTLDDIRNIVQTAQRYSVIEKRNLLLKHIASQTEHGGTVVFLEGKHDYPVAYCKNHEELDYLLEYLTGERLAVISQTMGFNYSITITPKGWEAIIEMEQSQSDSSQVFVAMSFDEKYKEYYENGIKPAIEESGYRCFRMDEKIPKEKICEEMLKEIRASKFLVIDCTGSNAGAYFEAGYAKALGKQVLWICNNSDKDNTHFDTRQYHHSFWDESQDLKDKLHNKILGSVGPGPIKP